MKAIVVSVALVAAWSGIAVAQTDAPKPVREKKVCRSEMPTGSMMAKTTCRTRAEWQSLDDADRTEAHRMLDLQSRTGGHNG